MTTNKPGSVNQQPHYGCTSCYEDWTWPADHLRVYDNECWCGPFWDERQWELPDQPDWDDLEPYTPALQAECEKLRKDAERYRGIVAAVLREHPHRNHNRGNAPGHSHSIPGVWDEDNGALAGKECAWCKTWNEALAAMQENKP